MLASEARQIAEKSSEQNEEIILDTIYHQFEIIIRKRAEKGYFTAYTHDSSVIKIKNRLEVDGYKLTCDEEYHSMGGETYTISWA